MTEKKELIEAILNPKNWKPNMSAIAEQTGMPLATVSDNIKKRIENCEIEITVRNLSESEALEKRKEKALEE